MTITTQQTEQLHSQYIKLTGLQVPYSMGRHYYWEQFIAAGHTGNDLSLLVGYIKRRIREKRREKESLMFRNLIQNLENTEDDLSMARAEARIPHHDPSKASVLRATQRPITATVSQPTPVIDVMEQHKEMARLLAEWRNKNP